MDNEKHKYEKLKNYIIETIKNEKLEYGAKIQTENELSVNFNVSRHTVRKAIGALVNEGWLYREQGKGTFVGNKEINKTKKTKVIGVITTFMNDYIFPSIIRGIESVLSEKGYSIVLACTYNQHEKERISLDSMKLQNVDGLIMEPTKSALPNPNIDIYNEIMSSGIPVLFINGFNRDVECNYVVEDDFLAGYLATKHLIDLGHKSICGLFKIDDVQGHYRFSGFHKAHIEAGLTFQDSNVIWFSTDEIKSLTNDTKMQKLDKIISECTAVVCYNDQIAIEIMGAIKSKGLKIPDDISVVSFDDSQLALISEVKLTTVAHPKEKLGEEAAKSIVEMVENKAKGYKVKMKPELMVRESTKDITNRG